ncbi:MAG: carboxyl-terminal processing protease [Chloroflexi bacterium]|nr:MAG: carboxyl-terminal processing protease [Chloroflexota bacterium]
MLVVVAAAFAVGVGVTGLLEDDDPIGSRTVRTSTDTMGARVSTVVTDTRGSRFDLLDEVYDILNREFVEPSQVDLERLRIAAIDGIVEALNDPHSVYIDEETFRLSSESISGAFDGIGATVQQDGSEIVISGTFRGSPAEAAGMRSGDVILFVDGESTDGWTLQFAVSVIRGERGTPVEITVRHQNDAEEVLTVIRDRIIVPSVQSFQIADRAGNPVTDIAFVLISQFTARTRSELAPLLEATANAGLSQIIIDLRGNPGGLLTATVDTTGEFLDGGLVLTEVDREGEIREFFAESGGGGTNLEVVLLVDGGSASGSEVMAAALRDHGRAVVIGEQTLGKGTVNIPRMLSDGSVLYVSVARWLSPGGDLIEGVGVIPDIIIAPTDEDFEQRRDVALHAAIDLLRGQQSAAAVGG